MRVVKESLDELLRLEKQYPIMGERLRMLQTLKRNPSIDLENYARARGLSLWEVASWWDMYEKGGGKEVISVVQLPRVDDPLTADQRRLFGDFEKLDESQKITFLAITEALKLTVLTPVPDRVTPLPVATAMELVVRVESVAGELKGERDGSKQFRLFANVRADAAEILAGSEEFGPAKNNPKFLHSGFPSSFKERGGVPSLQFSTRDAKTFGFSDLAVDIDIDYEGGDIVGLLRHLNPINSDVRHGDHFDKYRKKWRASRLKLVKFGKLILRG